MAKLKKQSYRMRLLKQREANRQKRLKISEKLVLNGELDGESSRQSNTGPLPVCPNNGNSKLNKLKMKVNNVDTPETNSKIPENKPPMRLIRWGDGTVGMETHSPENDITFMEYEEKDQERDIPEKNDEQEVYSGFEFVNVEDPIIIEQNVVENEHAEIQPVIIMDMKLGSDSKKNLQEYQKNLTLLEITENLKVVQAQIDQMKNFHSDQSKSPGHMKMVDNSENEINHEKINKNIQENQEKLGEILIIKNVLETPKKLNETDIATPKQGKKDGQEKWNKPAPQTQKLQQVQMKIGQFIAEQKKLDQLKIPEGEHQNNDEKINKNIQENQEKLGEISLIKNVLETPKKLNEPYIASPKQGKKDGQEKWNKPAPQTQKLRQVQMKMGQFIAEQKKLEQLKILEGEHQNDDEKINKNIQETQEKLGEISLVKNVLETPKELNETCIASPKQGKKDGQEKWNKPAPQTQKLQHVQMKMRQFIEEQKKLEQLKILEGEHQKRQQLEKNSKQIDFFESPKKLDQNEMAIHSRNNSQKATGINQKQGRIDIEKKKETSIQIDVNTNSKAKETQIINGRKSNLQTVKQMFRVETRDNKENGKLLYERKLTGYPQENKNELNQRLIHSDSVDTTRNLNQHEPMVSYDNITKNQRYLSKDKNDKSAQTDPYIGFGEIVDFIRSKILDFTYITFGHKYVIEECSLSFRTGNAKARSLVKIEKDALRSTNRLLADDLNLSILFFERKKGILVDGLQGLYKRLENLYEEIGCLKTLRSNKKFGEHNTLIGLEQVSPRCWTKSNQNNIKLPENKSQPVIEKKFETTEPKKGTLGSFTRNNTLGDERIEGMKTKKTKESHQTEVLGNEVNDYHQEVCLSPREVKLEELDEVLNLQQVATLIEEAESSSHSNNKNNSCIETENNCSEFEDKKSKNFGSTGDLETSLQVSRNNEIVKGIQRKRLISQPTQKLKSENRTVIWPILPSKNVPNEKGGLTQYMKQLRQCMKCKIFFHETNAIEHKRICFLQFACQICGILFPSYNLLKGHLVMHQEGSCLCRKCGILFLQKNIASHQSKCELPERIELAPLMDLYFITRNHQLHCKLCQKSFSSLASFATHVYSNHKNRSKKKQIWTKNRSLKKYRKLFSKKYIYNCKSCGKLSSNMEEKIVHYRRCLYRIVKTKINIKEDRKRKYVAVEVTI